MNIKNKLLLSSLLMMLTNIAFATEYYYRQKSGYHAMYNYTTHYPDAPTACANLLNREVAISIFGEPITAQPPVPNGSSDFGAFRCVWIWIDRNRPGPDDDAESTLSVPLRRYGNRCPNGSTYNADRGACDIEPKIRGEQSCPKCISGRTGNPIDIGTGNKFQIETDYQATAQGGLQYRRYYNSLGESTEVVSIMGRGWSADYSQRIIPVATDEVQVQRPDGKYLRFQKTNNVWVPDADVVLQLEELKDSNEQRTGWTLTLANDTVEEYQQGSDEVGRLITITTRQGLTVSLEYELTMAEGGDDIATTLDRVTDPYGRTLTFQYNAEGYLEAINDPAGNEIRYTRDSINNLASVIYPDDTPGDESDSPTRVYHYENISNPNHLTGITDETGNRFATWEYNVQGRAISSEHANGAERIDIVYNADGTTTVTESNGGTRTYIFETIQGVVQPTQITGDKCSNCSSDVESVTYDANGYPTSETDYNGNVTNFIYDARGLQTLRTEAVGTPEERTITTEWHSTFRLPIKITESRKITIFTYDTLGRLLKRKEEEK